MLVLWLLGSMLPKQVALCGKCGKLSALCPELSCEPRELQGAFKHGNLYGRRGRVCMLVLAVHASTMEKQR